MTKELLIENDYQQFFVEKMPTYDKVTYDANDGVVVIPTVVGRYCFIDQVSRESVPHSLELIRGFIENDESPVEAALRELNEEIGITVDQTSIDSVREFPSFSANSELTTQKIHVVLVQLRSSPKHIKLETQEGVDNIHWIEKCQLRYIIDEITDGVTLSALLKAKIV